MADIEISISELKAVQRKVSHEYSNEYTRFIDALVEQLIDAQESDESGSIVVKFIP